MLDVNAYLITIFIFVALLVAALIFYYAEAGTPWHSYLTIFTCYFSAFAILFMIPIDIAATIENRNYAGADFQSLYEDDKANLRKVYKTFYLILTVLASVVLILEEMYNSDGYFDPCSRFLSSVKRYLYDNGPYAVVGLIVFGILVGQGVMGSDNAAVLLTIILVSNTINLLLLMFILGYGLVAYPQQLWVSADVDKSLQRAENRVVAQYRAFNDYSIAVSQVVADAKKTREQLAQFGDKKLNDAIELILSECPAEFKASSTGKVAVNASGQITIDSLANLRMRLNLARDAYRLAQGRLEETKLIAYTSEDIAKAKKGNSKSIAWSFRHEPGGAIEYYWFTIVRPILLRLCSLGCFVLTLLSFLGIIGSFKGVNYNASAYFVTVHDPTTTPVSIVIFILITFGYMSSVTFWAMFQIKLSGSLEMVAFRTTPESLSFNARLVARLAAPLAFFYLGFIAENGTQNGDWVDSVVITNVTTVTIINSLNVTSYSAESTEMISSFASFYQIQVVPGMGDAFNTFYPGLLISFSFLVAANIINRILTSLKLNDYQFGDEIVTPDQLRDGKRLLEKQKKMMSRTVNRFNLRNAILGATKHEVDEDLEDKNSGDNCLKSLLAMFVGSPKPVEEVDFEIRVPQPAEISGWVEKKGAKGIGIDSGWQKRFFAVAAPGVLRYWKDDNVSKEPHGEVELRSVINLNFIPGKKGEQPRIDLELAEKTFKMRFIKDGDDVYWQNGLKAWKEYAIDRATRGDADVDPDEEYDPNADYDKMFSGMKSSTAVDSDAALKEAREQSRSAGGALGVGKKNAVAEELDLEETPEALEGWLEKKSHNVFNSVYQRRFFRVNGENGQLEYAKNLKELESAANSIDLNQVLDISQDQSEVSKFSINVGDKVYKLKASNKADCQRWVKGLMDWKDYIVLKMV